MTEKKDERARKVEQRVRCSTFLCGRPAVAYSTVGLLPKRDICMERNMHFAVEDENLPKWLPRIAPNKQI